MNGFSLGPIKNLRVPSGTGLAALSLVALVLLGAGVAAWQAGATSSATRPGQPYPDASKVFPVPKGVQPDKPTPSPSGTITVTGTLSPTRKVSPTRTATLTVTLTLTLTRTVTTTRTGTARATATTTTT